MNKIVRWAILFFVAIIILGAIASAFGGDQENDDENPALEYEIIEEENVDAINLSRRAYYIVVPTTITEEEIKEISEQIIESKDFDRIWLYYFYHDYNIIGLGYTVAMCDYEGEYEYNFRDKINSPEGIEWPTEQEFQIYKTFVDYGYGDYSYLSDEEIIQMVADDYSISYEDANSIIIKVVSWWMY